eukprot:CAMPEP_0184033454 /NCGR_PEP_ID=MMETSP0955-20130417/3770_1 /TAXON_ID=627963 /ORGANISM="Aplanochytrium sp, Strain PBS07" /LENGTH=580 /DNA_ID=CAMNT_0026319823 /DNA_START=21 /DNA_END=1763 /DNA_ORIENTATION=+
MTRPNGIRSTLELRSNKKTDETEISQRNTLFNGILYLQKSLATPLMVMYFLMLMVNTLLRDTKDTLLVTSKAGVEAIPILKSWLVIPCSVLFFLLYSKITSKFTKRKAFVIVLSLFVGFYLSFGIFLYPLKHYVSLGDGAKAWLESVLPRTFGPAFVALIDEWPLALFFVVSELWSSGVCQLMFWQVANDVMTVRQAKAYYPAIGAMGNLGMVVAGHFLMVFANQRDLVSAKAYLRITDNVKKHGDKRTLQQTLVNDLTVSERHPVFSPDSIIGHAVKVEHLNDPIEQGWSQTLAGIALMTLSSSVVIAMCYDSVYRRSRRPSIEIVNVDNQADILESGVDKKKKSNENKKPTKYFEGMRTLFQSKPLQCVAILVISYGVSSCLVEVCWKGQVKQAYPHPNDYSRFMAQFWFWTGAVSMIFMVMGRIVLEKLGYKFAILFTPIVMILAGSVFFLVALFQYFYEESMIPYAAYSGGFLVMIAKSAKYAFFDSTKEMMFIPLDQESKSVGKAAIELVAYRLAKSGGSFYLQLIIFLWGSITSGLGIIPIAAAFFFIMLLWTTYAYNGSLIMDSFQAKNSQAL